MEEVKYKIPESVLRVVEDVQKSYSGVLEGLGRKISEIDFPKFNLPEPLNLEGLEFISPERNAWERHEQNLSIQKDILNVQLSLLNEQKGNTKLTKIVLLLTICSIFIAIVSLVVSIFI
jgi:hypothetical protein